MNNTFNLQRFGLLLRRQWLEFGKIYLVSLLVLWGIFLAFYGYNYYNFVTDYRELHPGDYRYGILNFRIPLFIVTGIIFGTLVSSTYFSHLGQKPKAVIDLMTPASIFEKFLSGVLYTSVLATFSFLFLFYFTDLAFVAKIRSVFEEVTKSPIVEANHLDYFFNENNPNEFKPLYFVPFLITSIFLLGSIYFNRFHYIKTAISLMVFCAIWSYIIVKSGQALFENRSPIALEPPISNGKDAAEIWFSALLIALSFIFWGLTYLRLKEKEV